MAVIRFAFHLACSFYRFLVPCCRRVCGHSHLINDAQVFDIAGYVMYFLGNMKEIYDGNYG
jgi:hypothetical protein